MHVDQEKLKELVLDSGLVSREDIARAEKEGAAKGVSFGDILVNEDLLAEDELRRLEAYVLGIPYINLKDEKFDFAVLSIIPEPIARTHNIVAYKKTEDALEVAMLDIDALAAIDFLKKKVKLRILPRLADKESIRVALRQYQQDLKTEFGEIIKESAVALHDASGSDEEGLARDLKKLADDLPVVQIVETLLKHALIQDASDIHIEPRENSVLIRYRIDGILHDAMELPKTTAQGIIARVKVLANLKLDEKRLPQDGRFKSEIEKEMVSFRVSVIPTYYGEKAVLRLLRENVGGYTLETLGFHGKGLESIHQATKQKTGMILATGPTGSGKTTTLYTILEILNTPRVNISTIEDPIEYQLPRINQTQVKPEIGFTFANGLRALVRQDPDILMVGEIRDNETASLAVNAALTGHLVLSTLHTNSAAGAAPRLMDMKIEPFLLVSSVEVIISQRLVRMLCAGKERYRPTDEELRRLAVNADLDKVLLALKEERVIGPNDGWRSVYFYREKATPECEDGFSGRIGIHEVLPLSRAIKELIIKGASADEIEAEARQEGMMTMIEDGIFQAASGITTIEEVLRVVSE
ncbi:MAG: type II/IV secretion system protein [Parcubacteria group bacterium]|nr:type II/IV secretion system protein [Candidatus Liptonbacteria bacterium]MBI3020176.1 type II/IV secretion system protein [Parcubacteria group bacterium]MBI3075186.1 type II/IV secretion system protein [Parcubacteria group bacterium]